MRRTIRPSVSNPFEALESRQLLSGSIHPAFFPAFGGGGHSGNTILFDQAPSAVQTGLDTLATNAGLTAPDPSTSTQTVFLGISNGVETYTVYLGTSAPLSKFTVDPNGNQIVAPVISSETFATLTTNNPTSAAELTAMATALNLTAPTTTTNVVVNTPSEGTTTFSVTLASATSRGWHAHSTTISVDPSGNPVGNLVLPFDVIPMAIQTGLNAGAPITSSPYATTSTQPVFVSTQDGITTYSVVFSATGTQTKVTVNSGGNPAGFSQTTFASVPGYDPSTPTGAALELGTLATDDGITTPIASTQAVSEYTEGNGTVLYSVTLPGAPVTTPWGGTYTPYVTITVDQLGNPTVLPVGGDIWGFGCLSNFGGGGGFGLFGGFGGF